ncbi:MAG: DUF2012 domain-containing protein [Acidobacteria bacterium]|nr:DUF2012 domain-containing protein [Acidobacteriota bacterium]
MFPQRILGFVVLCFACFVAACGNEEKSAPSKPAYQSTGNEGRIAGTINLTGQPPAPRSVSMNADPVCNANGTYTTEEVVAQNGKLQNVFVYVKNGLPADVAFPPTETEVALRQKGCRYVPHVLGIHTSATLSVQSSDDTTHNVHPKPEKNREWDTNILPGADPFKRQFKQTEVMIPVKCGVHNWMSAWIGVLDHPFFAVTDANGTFTLTGLPPGEYEVEAWHETYKAQTLKVKVEAKAEAKADFTYNTATAYHEGKLMAQPAVIVP